MKLRHILFLITLALGVLLPAAAFASTGTIDSGNDTSRLCTNAACTTYTIVYWRTTHGTPVSVSDTALTGFIWSTAFGWINLNPTNGGVHNTTGGALSGYGWGDTASWVNFAPTHGGVSINTSTGEFSGYAWVSGAGWMLFDCSLADACVKTDWRPSTTTIINGCPGGNCGHGPPLKCLDPAAINYGGALPCQYLTLCTDPTATNYNFAGACTYSTTLPTTCADPTATNYRSAGACTYSTTICNDSSATNYRSSGACTYATRICTDRSATNYGGTLPCSYTSLCLDSAASNYNSAGPCTYTIPTLCLDHSAANYGSTLPCSYSTTICTDRSAENYGAHAACSYSTTTGDGDNGCTVVTTGMGTINTIIGNVKNSLCQTKSIIDDTTGRIKDVINTRSGDIITTTIAIVGLVSGAAVTLASVLFLNPVSFSELFLIPARLWSLLMSALGLKKRRRPWGTVYDSVTKQPLDPAYVTLRDLDGKEITSSITDLDGRFGFVVPQAGTYTIFAQKTNYLFPSQKLVGHDHDELYRDLYFGEHFTVAEAGDVVIRNIPMDPEHFDWNEFAKRQQSLMRFYSKRDKWLRRISDMFFAFGFTVSAIAVLAAPRTYNIVIFILYVLLYFIRVHGAHSRPYGFVVESATEMPVSFGIVRISNAATGVEVMHRITDQKGRYYALLPNGEYRVRIDRKLPDGTYQTILSDAPATVTKGYLAKVFSL